VESLQQSIVLITKKKYAKHKLNQSSPVWTAVQNGSDNLASNTQSSVLICWLQTR